MMTEIILDESYGDHCGSTEVHDTHTWRNEDGTWHCLGTFIRETP